MISILRKRWTIGCASLMLAMTASLFALPLSASAADLQWDWSQGTGEAADGFRIHYGSQSGIYTNQVDVGLVNQWHIPDTWPAGTYYFAASAYNQCCSPEPCTPQPCQSDYSNEIVYIRDIVSGLQPASGGSYQLTWIEDQQGMGAPTQVSATPAGPTGSSTALSFASVSWQTGDYVYVMASSANGLFGRLNTPSVTGLTFSLIAQTNSGNSGDYGKTYYWRATAGSSSSGAISCSKVTSGYAAGVVYVYRGSDGAGNNASLEHSANKTVSLTRGTANSSVIMHMVDWNAVNDTSVAATPTGTVDQAVNQSGEATWFGLSWGDQGATGTTSYGLTSHTGTVLFDAIAVEVRGTESGGASAVPIMMRQYRARR